MSLRVIHVVGSAQPQGSGIARLVRDIARNIDTSRFAIEAIFLGGNGPLVEELRSARIQVEVIEWPQGFRNPLAAARFWRYVRSRKADLIHQHFGGRSVTWTARRLLGIPVVVHLHGRIHESAPNRTVPFKLGYATGVIATSNAVAECVHGRLVSVVYPGIEIPPYIRANGGSTMLGSAGRLVPIKGYSHLLGAIAILREEFPGLQLQIAGDGPELRKLTQEVEELKIDDKVEFLGWRSDVLDLMKTWNVFVIPSVEESFCIAALEAMARGLPVVATSVGGLPELIEDGRTGYLVPPSDVAALASRLRLLIVDSERRRRMGAAGWKRAREHFSVEHMVRQIASVYDALLN
jgi:glycosyltransferase involved in cell wall biosynthesis